MVQAPMNRIFNPEQQATGRLALTVDWAQHALGPVEQWPQSLKTTVGILFSSRFPMFLAWGPDRHLFYNDAYAPILGKKHPGAFSRPFPEVWSDIWQEIEPLVHHVDRGEAVYLEDKRLLMHRNGFDEETYFTFSYNPIRNEHGDVGGLFCACVETTERKQSEKALKASEARLRVSEQRLSSVITQAAVGICETNFEGQFLMANDHYCKMVGRTHEELLNLRMQDITHPDDLPGNLEQFRKLSADNHDFEIEKRYVRPDGSVIWVHNSVSCINRQFVVAVSTDITAKRTAQIEFEKNVDVSPAILWITDADGKCTYLSKQWTDYTGQPTEEGLGFGWLNATHPDDKDRVGQEFAESNRNRVPFYVDYRLRTKSGGYRWAIDAANPRYDKQGRFQGYAGTVFDVHDRKMAELQNEALLEDLREAVRARDEFLSIASHELKTPLTSLKLQAQLHGRAVKKGDRAAYLPTRIDDLVKLTEKQVSRLTRLVDDMLDVSRIRSGKLNIVRERFDASQLVDEVIERMKHQFAEAAAPLPSVMRRGVTVGDWDRLRLEQVITNLLTNAIRYGKGKPVEVQVEAALDYVTIAVKDQGIGVSAEAKAKIFDRFERAINASEVSGLGLGLFITRQIVSAHGGKVWVESEPGLGSTFLVQLPKSPVTGHSA